MVVMNEVENNHKHVNKPREQVEDAEAVFTLTGKLVDSVRSYSRAGAGVTPAEFVSSLIGRFWQQKRSKLLSENSCIVSWQLIGSSVSSILMRVSGCKTMIGPMEDKLKQRKPVVRAKRARSEKRTLPEEFGTEVELATETDRNIHVMFEILKTIKKVEVERFILNKSDKSSDQDFGIHFNRF